MVNRVEKVGLAERAQRVRRARRVEMKLHLDEGMIGLLNGLLRAPHTLPTHQLGQREFPHYTAGDFAASREVVALQKWLEKACMKPIKMESGQDGFEFIEGTYGLKKVYVNRLLDIMKHYERMGRLASIVGPYCGLMDQLEGRIYEMDDPSEECGEEDEIAAEGEGEGEGEVEEAKDGENNG